MSGTMTAAQIAAMWRSDARYARSRGNTKGAEAIEKCAEELLLHLYTGDGEAPDAREKRHRAKAVRDADLTARKAGEAAVTTRARARRPMGNDTRHEYEPSQFATATETAGDRVPCGRCGNGRNATVHF